MKLIFRPLIPPRSLIMSRAASMATKHSLPFFAHGPVNGSSTPMSMLSAAASEPAESISMTIAVVYAAAFMSCSSRPMKRTFLMSPGAPEKTRSCSADGAQRNPGTTMPCGTTYPAFRSAPCGLQASLDHRHEVALNQDAAVELGPHGAPRGTRRLVREHLQP